MEVLRMDPISDLSSTQEYSDIDLEGDSREIEAGSPGDMSMVAAVEVRKLAAGMSGAAAGHGPSCGSDGEQPPSPHGSSRATSPSSAASSSMNSPQPQVWVLFVLIICFNFRRTSVLAVRPLIPLFQTWRLVPMVSNQVWIPIA